jgi:predicted metal-dependent phosphoesterase TrpH
MEEVDKQVEEIKEEWKQEELQATLERAQEAFPEAEVSLHNDQGAVLIEHPPDGSKAQDLLGGAMEIKSPWRF